MTGDRPMVRRLIVLACCFLATAAIGARTMRPERVALREPLDLMPAQLAPWTGLQSPPLAGDVLATLGVDDYLNRVYSGPDRAEVALFVGYYQSQREGDTIHSPLNCLPGAGWQPISRQHVAVTVPGHRGPLEVNQFLIQKGMDQQIVLYWYQSHGRVEASEYWSKAYLIWDAIRRNRSDAALVRVITPVLPSDRTKDEVAARAIAFVQVVFPQLERFLPS